MALEFRVLGPLEVLAAGRPLAIGGPRQRELLALLLIHGRGLVSTDVLLEELFSGRHDSGRNALQVAVMRLRRALGDGDLIATGPDGYSLQVASEQVDAHRFEWLLAAARDARAGGDDGEAAARLREGLALWRGRALSDLGAHDFVERERRRLEELRLAAIMDRVDVDLALGRSAELVVELEQLVTAHPLQERLRGQLMLALYRAGRQADALAAYQATRRMLDRELGLEPSRALQELQRAILVHDRALEASVPRRAGADVCPFKGLGAFEATDAEYFFGRERVVAGLIARLAEDSFLALVGPSGSGKSSTLRAGLLPALAEGALPGSARRRRVLVRPGARPLEALERKLDGAERPLIVVDQFEELFVACTDERQRAAFAAALVEAATDRELGAIVVLGIRADFYGRCAAYPELAELLSGRTVLLPPMNDLELARAIREPGARAGLDVEPELIDALTRDLAGTAGGLPLLSSTLLELWQRREGSQLTLAAYERTGGVEASVARLAEGAFAVLDDREHAAARRILLRLAGEQGGALVGRRVALADFDSDTDAAASRAMTVLTERRLLTVDHGHVELAHEALLRHWPRLGGWLEDDVQGRRVHGHLMQAAREWDAAGREPSLVYRGSRLAAALEWASGQPDALNVLERDFLAAAREQQELESTRQRRQNRRLRAALAGAIGLLAVALAAGAVALVQRHSARRSAQISLAHRLGAEALIEPRVDRALLLAREAVALDDSPDTAGALLGTLLRSPAAVGTFSLPLGLRPQRVTVGPDGHTLAVVDNSDTVRLYDARTHREVAPPRPTTLSNLPAPFTADGAVIVPGPDAKTGARLEIRDARTLRLRDAFPYSPGLMHSPAIPTALFASAGRIFVGWAEPGGPGRLDAWNLRTRRWSSIALGSNGLVGAGPAGGGRVVTVSTTAAAIWDARTGRRLSRRPVAAADAIAAVAPDARHIALTYPSGGLHIVDLRTGAVRRALVPGGANAAVFSPDGRLLATPGNSADVVLWNATTARALDTFRGHGGRVIAAGFAPDGRTLYSASLDGSIFAWDLTGDRGLGRPFRAATTPLPQTFATPPLAVAPDGSAFVTRTTPAALGVFGLDTLRRHAQFTPFGPHAAVRAVAWGPGGALVAGDDRGRVALVHVAAPQTARLLGTLPSAVVGLTISPGGETVAAIEGDPNAPRLSGSLTLWRTATGSRLRRPIRFATNAVGVAFSPDGARLAVALGDGRALLLEARTGRLLRTLRFADRPRPGFTFPTSSLSFARDGTLATGSYSGIVGRWNPVTGARLGHPLLAAAAPVGSLAFSPDGATLATTGASDGVAKLWDAGDGQQLGAGLPGSTGRWGNAVFTPDGRLLIAVYDDGRGTVWPARLDAWERQACAIAARPLTRDEWTRYVPGRPYARVC